MSVKSRIIFSWKSAIFVMILNQLTIWIAFLQNLFWKLPYVDGITADRTVNSISVPDVIRGSDGSRRQSVGGWDEQQFNALPIEYYTCLSRLERCNVVLEGVISSMTFPRRKWPQKWFILLWEASPSRQSFRPIFPRTKSKVQSLCLHVHFCCPLWTALCYWRYFHADFVLFNW